MGTSPRSLNATSSKSLPRSSDARKKLRPMRPKPLMPTRVFAMGETLDRDRSALLVNCSVGDRYLDAERAALCAVRLDPDAAAQPGDELAADGHAGPGGADATGHVRIDAV